MLFRPSSRHARIQILLSTATLLSFCALSLIAADAPRAFPLWDGKESIESYAARVNMPATKNIDLGGGVTLDLVLIPAGQFIMGSAEPAKPTLTVANSNWLIGIGGGAAALLLLVLIVTCIKKRKLSVSLRWLLLMTIATGLCIGGIARRSLAIKEAARYESELAVYISLPANEKPAHSVTLTQPFYMGKYTVTQAQYEAVMGRNPSWFKGATLPVTNASWNDATQFCKKLNGILDDKTREVRLPSEAQWEYTCRAGTQTRFYSGDLDSDLDAMGWFDSNSGGKMHPVGQKKPNAFGLYDMHGNVWQWCEDSYVDHYETNETTNPVNERGGHRVTRGGSWNINTERCRASYRDDNSPFSMHTDLSFRVVVVPKSTTP
ncbi:MAG TPA: formylglycine-generating enzyme family protein [Planctomycetota bacterium]|nr:formylglycine-generating enzyme family protein [Planctomycetota bacterium]